MRTMLLDVAAWDLVVDASGNIAVAEEPYALAQDAASAIRLFLGELYYDTRPGVPYYQEILGKSPPVALVKARMVEAALRVPEVVSAQVFISDWTDRVVRGQVQVRDATGSVTAARF